MTKRCATYSVIWFMFASGKELTVPHQMSLAGGISLPVFWLAGAGAALFWILGKRCNC